MIASIAASNFKSSQEPATLRPFHCFFYSNPSLSPSPRIFLPLFTSLTHADRLIFVATPLVVSYTTLLLVLHTYIYLADFLGQSVRSEDPTITTKSSPAYHSL